MDIKELEACLIRWTEWAKSLAVETQYRDDYCNDLDIRARLRRNVNSLVEGEQKERFIDLLKAGDEIFFTTTELYSTGLGLSEDEYCVDRDWFRFRLLPLTDYDWRKYGRHRPK